MGLNLRAWTAGGRYRQLCEVGTAACARSPLDPASLSKVRRRGACFNGARRAMLEAWRGGWTGRHQLGRWACLWQAMELAVTSNQRYDTKQMVVSGDGPHTVHRWNEPCIYLPTWVLPRAIRKLGRFPGFQRSSGARCPPKWAGVGQGSRVPRYLPNSCIPCDDPIYCVLAYLGA